MRADAKCVKESPETPSCTLVTTARSWWVPGAIEAVYGLILFGLTTAFLFAAIKQVWRLWRD
jgi:hypothetical protein